MVAALADQRLIAVAARSIRFSWCVQYSLSPALGRNSEGLLQECAQLSAPAIDFVFTLLAPFVEPFLP